MNDRRDQWLRFESTWGSAVKLCETAAEAAYASGGCEKDFIAAGLNCCKAKAFSHSSCRDK